MYGDKLTISSSENPTDVVEDKPVKLSYKVTNKAGKDVTNYYNFDIENIHINITPRDIGFDLYQKEKDYDGKTLSIDKLKVIRGSLAKYDRVVANIITDTPIINAGTYSLKFKIGIFDSNNRDVSKNYNYDKDGLYNFTINPTVIDFNLSTIKSKYSYKSGLIDELCTELTNAVTQLSPFFFPPSFLLLTRV